ncbi:MAG: hypothetical protein LBN95_08750 [Prevotellaceae bacterium]|jgi:molybdopterin synthase catalytic subunit/sRNA-binding regulator protein Hfq|nr:hypothetical protein [Prevotellaceae bacterium]
MKKIFILTSFLFFGIVAFAQDIIFLKNGDEIQVIVQEVGEKFVICQQFDNQDLEYNIAISEIFMIKYADGTKDVFYQEEFLPQQPEKEPVRLSQDDIYYELKKMEKAEITRLMSSQSPDIYKDYKSSKRNTETGATLLFVGIVGDIASVFTGGFNTTEGTILAFSAGALETAGIINLIVGKVRRVRAINAFATEIYEKRASFSVNKIQPEYNFGLIANGICFKINF